MGRRKSIEGISEYLKVNLPLIELCPGQVYQNNKTHIRFKCSEHGYFNTTWNQITRGSHCPQCGEKRLLHKAKSKKTRLEDVLNRIDKVHDGRITMVHPNEYQKQHSRLTFECEVGHRWDAVVYQIIQGRGCPKCAGKNITTDEFKATLNRIHKDTITLVSGQKYISRKTKLRFKCNNPNHPVFSASPSNVVFNKSGCPECKKEKLRVSFALTTEEVYFKIAEKCGDQVKPIPNQIYVNQNSIWEFTCPVPTHQNWKARIDNVLNTEYKYGCKECKGETSYRSLSDIKSDLKQVFNERIELVSFSDPTFRKQSEGSFRCLKHGEVFQNSLANLFNSYGCSQCSVEAQREKTRKNSETLIKDVFRVHRELITVADPSQYVNTDTKIEFRCIKKRHGSFQSTPHSILRGNGCPICRMSSGERKILFWLRDNSIEHKYQWRVNKHVGNGQFIYDFFLPKLKTLIEFDGRQHFEPVEAWGGEKGLAKTRRNDKLKNEYAILKGLNLIRIKYTEFEDLEEILSDLLSS